MERSTVALVRCASYDVDEVYAALKHGVELLGGLDRFVRAGEKTLLKPNLLAAEPPEKAVTTHPSLLEASARLLGEAGGACCYGDSPGRDSPGHAARGCGMAAAAKRCGIEMADFVGGAPLPVRPVEGVAATYESSYPIARGLYVYTSGEPSGTIRAYLDWILSPEGQAIVKEQGFVPLQ